MFTLSFELHLQPVDCCILTNQAEKFQTVSCYPLISSVLGWTEEMGTWSFMLYTLELGVGNVFFCSFIVPVSCDPAPAISPKNGAQIAFQPLDVCVHNLCLPFLPWHYGVPGACAESVIHNDFKFHLLLSEAASTICYQQHLCSWFPDVVLCTWEY